jgi:hypothetical protein
MMLLILKVSRGQMSDLEEEHRVVVMEDGDESCLRVQKGDVVSPILRSSRMDT